jgi:hypothetical protein
MTTSKKNGRQPQKKIVDDLQKNGRKLHKQKWKTTLNKGEKMEDDLKHNFKNQP